MAGIFYRQIFHHVDETIRAQVEATFAIRFPHLKVRVRSAQLVAGGIEVRGLSIAEPDAAGPQAELLYVDEVLLACQTSVHELMRGEPAITSVKVIRPVFSATHRPDGSWSTSKLLPLPESKSFAPQGTIENGRIVIFDPLKNPSSTLTLRDINLSIARIEEESAGGHPAFDISGYLAADQMQRVELAGRIEPNHGRWSLTGTVDGLDISPELRDALPQSLAHRLEGLRGLRGRADLSFRVSGDDSAATRFELRGKLLGGRLDDPLLPYPVADIKADVQADNQSVRIWDLTARHGPTLWEVASFERRGYDAHSPFTLTATGKQVRLDPHWSKTLPEPWRTDWLNFDPEGSIDLDCTLSYDGQRYTPNLRVACHNNVSFSCHKFPYRLERASGTLTLQNNALVVTLTAYSGVQPVKLSGRFWNPGPQFTGAMEVRGDEIQFDEKLFAALLKPKARETVRELNPRGTFNFYARLWRDDPAARDMHQHVEIHLSRTNCCSINYKRFPYELKSLQGSLVMDDGQWRFPELVATHATGVVTGRGGLATTPAYDVLDLHIDAANVPLDQELRDALQPAQQSLWTSLRPRGSVDLQVDIHNDSRAKPMGIDLHVFPRDDATAGTSIEPVAFAYRMENLRGQIHYRDGHVSCGTFRRRTARRVCRPTEPATWRPTAVGGCIWNICRLRRCGCKLKTISWPAPCPRCCAAPSRSCTPAAG